MATLVMNHLLWFNDCLASVGLPETCQLEQQFGAAKVGTSVSYVSPHKEIEHEPDL